MLARLSKQQAFVFMRYSRRCHAALGCSSARSSRGLRTSVVGSGALTVYYLTGVILSVLTLYRFPESLYTLPFLNSSHCMSSIPYVPSLDLSMRRPLCPLSARPRPVYGSLPRLSCGLHSSHRFVLAPLMRLREELIIKKISRAVHWR